MILDPKRRFKLKYKITKDILKEKEIIDTPLGKGIIINKERYVVYKKDKKGQLKSNIDFEFTIYWKSFNQAHEFRSIYNYNSFINKLWNIDKKERNIYACRKFRDVKKCSECLRCGKCCLTSETGKDIIF